MNFTREWAMPNKWTFTIPPIAKLIKEEVGGRFSIDPFAGKHSPATTRNDLNPDMPTQYHMDALEFLEMQLDLWGVGYFQVGIFDAPYSMRQVKECYQEIGRPTPPEQTKSDYLSKCKDRLALLIAAGGKVVSCGWNSGGMGKGRGFELDKILLVAHGGPHNDTIVTVETKVQDTLTRPDIVHGSPSQRDSETPR